MRTKFYILSLLIISAIRSEAQELFIHAEPASTLPKNLFSVRYGLETYEDEYIRRQWHALRFMYGITSKLSLTATMSASNHHAERFPDNPWAYFQNHHGSGFSKNYPLRFEGFHFFGKYKLFSLDEKNGHIRIAAFGEASQTLSAHDEAEPNLMGDNAGFGGGIIATKLIKKLAISATAGIIKPITYKEPDKNMTFQSGDATYFMISAGYLLYPLQYKSYKDLNINIYLEALYKEYQAGALYIEREYENLDVFPYLREGKYLEIRPGLQFIMDSKNRLDLSFAVTAYGNTFIRNNPTVFIGYQRYLFK